MDYTQIILTVNTSSIIILVILAFILLAATRFRGENGYAAAIIVAPNIPVYLYNVSRMLGWHDIALFLFPISYSVNTTLLPLLWLFTQKNFRSDFRFRPRQLLHFVPALLFLILCLVLPAQERMDSILHEMSGDDTWVGDANTAGIAVQLFTYFPMIFRFLHRRRREIQESISNAEWIQKEWIPQLMILFASLFVVVMGCYMIWPRTDAWLIQILNVIAMSFLVYNSIAHPMLPVRQPEPAQTEQGEQETATGTIPSLSQEQMREICDKASQYLQTTKAYVQPDISLALFAKEIDVPQRTLSRCINGYLRRNFFEFINEMRVEEAKRRLLELDASGYNIDSIYTECGFRSRSTFFLVFKKVEGKTPAAWLKEQKGCS